MAQLYHIKHSKTGHEQVIDERGLEIITKRGWHKQYAITKATQSNVKMFLPPEVQKLVDKPEPEISFTAPLAKPAKQDGGWDVRIPRKKTKDKQLFSRPSKTHE